MTTKNPTQLSAGLFAFELASRCRRRHRNRVKRSQSGQTTFQLGLVSRRQITSSDNRLQIGCKCSQLVAICVKNGLVDFYHCHDLIQLSFDLKKETEQCFCKKPEGDTAQRHTVMPIFEGHTSTVRRRYSNCKQPVQES